MIRFLMLLAIIALIGAFVVVMVIVGKRQIRQKDAEAELMKYEDFIDDLQRLAVDHMGLGESFVIIVADEIRAFKANNKMEKEKK